MIIDGEKYACDACVRGHRVSNCQHHDRELQHINKKGRPVSQCQHCRGLRRSKSSHVKCECGEKTKKCVHTKGPHDSHRAGCCCKHGGACTCSHKKDASPVDASSELIPAKSSSTMTLSKSTRGTLQSRSRANTNHSTDSLLSFDDHGNRRPPTHKVSKPSQTSSPYQYSHTQPHGISSGVSTPTSSCNILGRDSTSRGGLRRVQSEKAPVAMSGTTSLSHGHSIAPLDLSASAYQASSLGAYDLFANGADVDQPIWSAGLGGEASGMRSIDWSLYDGLGSTAAGPRGLQNYLQTGTGQALSQTGLESTPTLATSPSGNASEVEDFLPQPFEEFDQAVTFGQARDGSTGFRLGLNTPAALKYNSPAPLGGDDMPFGIASPAMPNAVGFSLVEEDPLFENFNQSFDYTAHSFAGPETLHDSNPTPYWDLGS